MSRPEWENYNDEYLISLNNDGIWCEQMKSDGKYLTDESVITYILDNCSSKVIPYCKGNIVFEVFVSIDKCDDDDKGYTVNGKPVSKEEFDAYMSQFKNTDGNPVTTSSATYFVNNKEVDKETYEKALNELDEKYLDNVQDMLLNYFDFVNEMNQWRKLLGW